MLSTNLLSASESTQEQLLANASVAFVASDPTCLSDTVYCLRFMYWLLSTFEIANDQLNSICSHLVHFPKMK